MKQTLLFGLPIFLLFVAGVFSAGYLYAGVGAQGITCAYGMCIGGGFVPPFSDENHDLVNDYYEPHWREYSITPLTPCHLIEGHTAEFLKCMKQYEPICNDIACEDTSDWIHVPTTTVNMTAVHCEGFDCKDLQKVIDATPTSTSKVPKKGWCQAPEGIGGICNNGKFVPIANFPAYK